MNTQQTAVIIIMTIYVCWNVGIWITYSDDRKEDRSGWATGVGVIMIVFAMLFVTTSKFCGVQ